MNLYYPISKLTTVPSYFDQIGLDPSLGYSTKKMIMLKPVIYSKTLTLCYLTQDIEGCFSKTAQIY